MVTERPASGVDSPVPPEHHRVAVVIVNHNTEAHLANCLTSLFGGGLDGVDADVWVVDNASIDGSLAMLRRFAAVRLIESQGNAGFSAANNLAMRAIGYVDSPAGSGVPHGNGDGRSDEPPALPHVLLLNPDTIVPAGAVRQLLDVLVAEPDVGVVGPKLVLPEGELDLACRRSFPTPEVSFYRFSGLARLFPRHRRFGRYNLTFLDPDEPNDVDSVVGACMLVRREAILQAGLLDERFWMYGEDLDWALRIHRRGWRVVYRPQVVITHVKRAASRKSRRANFEFQRAMWLFYEKHYRPVTSRPVDMAVRLAVALRGGLPLAREVFGARAR